MGCGPEHMAEERVHFSRERGRSRERESIFKREEFKRGIQEGEEKCGLGIYPLLLDTTPNGCLDQLGPMLGSGCCFVAPPNQ